MDQCLSGATWLLSLSSQARLVNLEPPIERLKNVQVNEPHPLVMRLAERPHNIWRSFPAKQREVLRPEVLHEFSQPRPGWPPALSIGWPHRAARSASSTLTATLLASVAFIVYTFTWGFTCPMRFWECLGAARLDDGSSNVSKILYVPLINVWPTSGAVHLQIS